MKFYFYFFSESLYSVQNIANIRIRLIFGYSNTLVYRLGTKKNAKSLGSMESFEVKVGLHQGSALSFCSSL